MADGDSQRDTRAQTGAAAAAEAAIAAATLAALDGGEQPSRKRVRLSLCDNARLLESMKTERMATKARLTAIAKAERAAKRRATMLNKKAARLGLHELLELSLVKYEVMKEKGQLASEAVPCEAAASGSASSSTSTKMKAFGEMMTHAATMAKKLKHQPPPAAAAEDAVGASPTD